MLTTAIRYIYTVYIYTVLHCTVHARASRHSESITELHVGILTNGVQREIVASLGRLQRLSTLDIAMDSLDSLKEIFSLASVRNLALTIDYLPVINYDEDDSSDTPERLLWED